MELNLGLFRAAKTKRLEHEWSLVGQTKGIESSSVFF